uniref:Uncharacterized protein n=1 Tax=Anguilla anguilla TaxID=7936 RepID=A0A0E9S0U3_ANGAN
MHLTITPKILTLLFDFDFVRLSFYPPIFSSTNILQIHNYISVGHSQTLVLLRKVNQIFNLIQGFILNRI